MTLLADQDDYRWLTGTAGAEWLEKAEFERQQPGFSQVRLTSRLRAELPTARARLVLEQVELRRRGAEKFAQAASMFFTPLGFEQATDELIAIYKAGRFPPGVALADLCCGIGGDTIGLALRGPVVAVDRDPVSTAIAEANLGLVMAEVERAGRERYSSRILTAEIGSDFFVQHDLHNLGAWHIDPDRRATGHRTTKVELYEPCPETIRDLLATNANAAVKLAPAADLDDAWWHDAELEWISRGRQCRQLVAWFGDLAQHSRQRRATVIAGQLGQSPRVAASFVGEPDIESDFSETIGRYLYEPDAAVLAAKLEGALAAQHQLSAIAGGVAYFTGDQIIADAALSGFEVQEVMPYDVKRLKAWLAERRIGRLEIKKRGVPLEPDRVRRELRATGEGAMTILLCRVAGQVTAILAHRLQPGTTGS